MNDFEVCALYDNASGKCRGLKKAYCKAEKKPCKFFKNDIYWYRVMISNGEEYYIERRRRK